MKIKDLITIVYDVEVFRNCFTCAIYNTETKELKVFEISERNNDLSEIVKLFTNTNYIFAGYNSIHFDNPIMNYIIMYENALSSKSYYEVTQSIFNLAQIIIQSDDNDFSKWKDFKYANCFESIDLLTMYFSKALRVSLKEMQVTMMYKNVQEFDLDWNIPIHKDQINRLISYNINDVMSTTELLNKSLKDIDLRINIEKEYGINVLSKDGMKIGISVLEELYSKETGLYKRSFQDLRTIYSVIPLKDCILPCIQYKHKSLQDLLERMRSKVLVNTKSELKESVVFSGNLYSIGTGGLHTKDSPSLIVPTENEVIIDSDVNSYYPSLLIEWGFFPKHLGSKFLDVYKRIYEERLEAKRQGNKTVNETLKLSLNGTYGNLINEHSWLFDRKAAMSITVNGQLFLLMLAEMLTEIGCKVISANTDGVTCIVPKHLIEQHQKICDLWCNISKMSLEHTEYIKIIRYAVNDYIAVKKGFHEANEEEKDYYIKEKGLFITNTRIGKGLSPLIIPRALKKYFVFGEPIEKTVYKSTDIREFLMSEKTGKQWNVEHNGLSQQRVNRFIASKNAPYLLKWKLVSDGYGKEIKQYSNMLVDSGVLILNDLTTIESIKYYKLNYPYYLSQIRKIIEEIQPRQLSLF